MEVPIPGLELFHYPDKQRCIYITGEGGRTYMLYHYRENQEDALLHSDGVSAIKSEIIGINDECHNCTKEETKKKLGFWVDRIVAFATRFGNRSVPSDIRSKCNQEEEYIGRAPTDFGPDYGVWVPDSQSILSIENPTAADRRAHEGLHYERYLEIANEISRA
jgi:hypothetical protein